MSDPHSFVLLCFYSLLLLDLILVLALFKDIGEVFSILTLNRVPSSGTWSGAPPQASLSLGLGQQTPWLVSEGQFMASMMVNETVGGFVAIIQSTLQDFGRVSE